MKLPAHLRIFLYGSLFTIAGNLFLGFVNYFTRRTMAVTLSDVEYGCFYGAFAMISILLVFLDVGITDAGTIMVAENEKERKSIYFNLWTWKAAVGGVFSILLLCFANLITERYFHGIGRLMLVFLCIYTAFQTLNGTFISYTFGRKEYQIKSLYQIIKAILLLILVCLLTPRYALSGAGFAYLLSAVLIEPFHIWWVCKHEKGHQIKPFNAVLKKRFFSLIGIVAVITFMQTLLFHMNSVMLTILNGPRSTAVYNIAIPITQLLLSFLVFSNVFLPLAVDMVKQKEYSKLKKYAAAATFLCLVSLPVIYFIMKFSAEFLISFLFKSSYAKEAAPPLVLLMLGFILYSFGAFITQILIAMRKVKTLLLGSTLTVICNIVLNYFLIKAWDVTGAAAATLLSYLFFAVFMIFSFYAHTINFSERQRS